MAFSLELNVTPEMLKTQSAQIGNTVDQIRTLLGNLQGYVEATSSYWKGEAADLHRNDMDSNEQQIQEVLARIAKYPTDILEMAGIYEGAESDNVSVSNQLLPDVQLI